VLATWEALRNVFGLFIGALYVLFGLPELGLSALLVGISVGVGGTITPLPLLRRVNATMHIIARGLIPFSALAGGILGDVVGLRPTLIVAAVGITVSALWLARSASGWAVPDSNRS
jgi:hypothetical protein